VGLFEDDTDYELGFDATSDDYSGLIIGGDNDALLLLLVCCLTES
jgi:hypothetical protein